MYRSDFQKLAEDRIADARALFEARRYDSAYYLAGFAVECALKACIAKRGRHHQFPLSPESAGEVYSHDFEKLPKAADLAKSFEKARLADHGLGVCWSVVKDWTEKSRYTRNGRRVGKQKAQAMINAVADPDHGVLQCLRTDW